MIRIAECRCGAVRPVRVSVCHCLACQRRTGSAFAAQARFPSERVTVTGETRTYVRTADSGGTVTYRFCPDCGSTIAYDNDLWPGLTAVPLGAFADPDFPAPRFSVYERRKHAWVAIAGDDVEHHE